MAFTFVQILNAFFKVFCIQNSTNCGVHLLYHTFSTSFWGQQLIFFQKNWFSRLLKTKLKLFPVCEFFVALSVQIVFWFPQRQLFLEKNEVNQTKEKLRRFFNFVCYWCSLCLLHIFSVKVFHTLPSKNCNNWQEWHELVLLITSRTC